MIILIIIILIVLSVYIIFKYSKNNINIPTSSSINITTSSSINNTTSSSINNTTSSSINIPTSSSINIPTSSSINIPTSTIPSNLTNTNTKLFEKYVNEKYLNKKDLNLDNVPLIVDFSYAGYKQSEQPITIKNETIFNVLDYGADKTGTNYSIVAIQNAINAAAANSGGIVYFPKGIYKVNDVADTTTITNVIYIRSSNIVLKGENKEETIILIDKPKTIGNSFTFNFMGASSTNFTANVINDADRGSNMITLDSIGNLQKGDIINLKLNNIPENIAEYKKIYFKNITLNKFLNLDTSLVVSQYYEIDEVNITNKTIKIKGVFHTFILGNRFLITRPYKLLDNCGVEDLTFKGNVKYLNWKGEIINFVHHYGSTEEVKRNVSDPSIRLYYSMLHDAGWNAMQFQFTKHCWIRNCIHDSLSLLCQNQKDTMNHTCENIIHQGAAGHSSVNYRGTNHLIQNIICNAAIMHGPALTNCSNGNVFKNIKLYYNQSIDCHGHNPFSTLLDNIDNGFYQEYGGGEPNHGRWFTVWNCSHQDDKDYDYDFWQDDGKKQNSVVYPIIVGMGKTIKSVVDVEYAEKINDNGNIYPVSLFDAQLNLRMYAKN